VLLNAQRAPPHSGLSFTNVNKLAFGSEPLRRVEVALIGRYLPPPVSFLEVGKACGDDEQTGKDSRKDLRRVGAAAGSYSATLATTVPSPTDERFIAVAACAAWSLALLAAPTG
jgi:hypothetical protein